MSQWKVSKNLPRFGVVLMIFSILQIFYVLTSDNFLSGSYIRQNAYRRITLCYLKKSRIKIDKQLIMPMGYC